MKKLQYNSPVILTFFFLSLAALVLDYLTGGITTAALFSVYRAPLTSPLTYVRAGWPCAGPRGMGALSRQHGAFAGGGPAH